MTYVQYAWPRRFAAAIWAHPYLVLAISTAVGLLGVLAGALALRGPKEYLTVHTEPGAFYAVIPWLAMMVPSMLASIFIVAVIIGAVWSFWRSAPDRRPDPTGIRVWAGALQDAFTLRYLSGGGPGCPYPDDERPSGTRRWLHHLIFYGFAADFASTVVAAAYQDLLGQLPPYPIWSAPVVLGSVGGLALILGCSGTLYLKLDSWRRTRQRPGPQGVAFLVVLDLVAITGMVLLAFRTSRVLGPLLTAHLAMLFALYLTLPYGKFVHGAFRFAALLRNRMDEVRANRALS